MPELVEQMYCSQQIVIPPKFPYMLKKYCKAAIKTQPYDLLRWSFEYFKALAQNKPPPVKLRLEYPIYSTEGGLTRGCLKVLANQLSGLTEIPLPVVKNAWRGFCLDPEELRRIFCLCEVYCRAESVPFLHFIAVAGGMLTKCLTHTMILLCESLTKEPDGGSAAIPLKTFFAMYRFLAVMDASHDVKYFNGYRDGFYPEPEQTGEEELPEAHVHLKDFELSEEDFWQGSTEFRQLPLIDDKVSKDARLSLRGRKPIIGKLERSPSVERARQIERENYMLERKGKATASADVDRKLRALSSQAMGLMTDDIDIKKPGDDKGEETRKQVTIQVFDEDEQAVQYEIYGNPPETDDSDSEDSVVPNVTPADDTPEETEAIRVALFIAEIERIKEERLVELEEAFEELARIVDRYNSANYDLGSVAGRQMSTTSGEYIAAHIEREIMAYVDDQIAILPDPDLKKKKAKPEEVEMVRDLVYTWLDENMDIIVPELEDVEEEETPIPEVTVVYAVPGIGPTVEAEIVSDFEEYAREVCRVQNDLIMPRNLRHFLCPPLEKYVETNYEVTDHVSSVKLGPKKEEAVLGGTLAN